MTKLSLHDLSQAELAKKEQNLVRGGSARCGCGITCGCLYAGPKEDENDSFYGGSSFYANEDANVSQQAMSVNQSLLVP